MSSDHLLDELAIVTTTDTGAHLSARIDDDWGILYVQGGVVMAVMMQAAETVLARDDLRLVTVATTFCRPVPCGPVDLDVTVLRNGRHGAQVHVVLHVTGDPDPSPNAVATVVCAAESPGWPEVAGATMPDAFLRPPDGSMPRIGTEEPGAPMAFFRKTDWRNAGETTDPMRHLSWFSFADPHLRPDGTWVPAMLAVPADALGMAAGPPVTEVMGRLTAPSLQISLQLFVPARGQWLGIDSRCHDNRGSLASGVALVWNSDGSLVASATQTAMFRRARI
ncbi:MAG: thioesterase family protein [Acidimicrobiales bacterium]|nr:thioesterase family protein [Acidimicrobiales bacterium]